MPGNRFCTASARTCAIIVADQLERVRLVARGDQRELGIALERPVEVAHLAVDPRRQRRLGQARADRRGDVGRRRALGHLAHRSVGKRDLEHLGHRAARSSRRAAAPSTARSERRGILMPGAAKVNSPGTPSLGRFLRRVQRRAFVAQLGAGPQLAEVAADDMPVDDRQPDAADRARSASSSEVQLDATGRARRSPRSTGCSSRLSSCSPSSTTERSPGGCRAGIGEGGELADPGPALAEHVEQVTVERRLRSALFNSLPMKSHASFIPPISSSSHIRVADPVGHRIELVGEQSR